METHPREIAPPTETISQFDVDQQKFKLWPGFHDPEFWQLIEMFPLLKPKVGRRSSRLKALYRSCMIQEVGDVEHSQKFEEAMRVLHRDIKISLGSWEIKDDKKVLKPELTTMVSEGLKKKLQVRSNQEEAERLEKLGHELRHQGKQQDSRDQYLKAIHHRELVLIASIGQETESDCIMDLMACYHELSELDTQASLVPAPAPADASLLPASAPADASLLPTSADVAASLLPTSDVAASILHASADVAASLLPTAADVAASLLPASASLLPAPADAPASLIPAPADAPPSLIPAPADAPSPVVHAPPEASADEPASIVPVPADEPAAFNEQDFPPLSAVKVRRIVQQPKQAPRTESKVNEHESVVFFGGNIPAKYKKLPKK